MDHWIHQQPYSPLETRAFPLPSSHLSDPESCFPAALPHSTTASCHALLHRRIQPAWGRGRGLSCRRGAGQVPTTSALCPLLGSTSRNAGVLRWVGAVVSALRDAAGCYMVWTPLSWENAAGSGGSKPSSPGGTQSGNCRSRVRHKAPRRAGASPRPSAIPESARSMGAFSLSFSFPSRRALQPSQNPAFVRIF